jgi:hypothetical protein
MVGDLHREKVVNVKIFVFMTFLIKKSDSAKKIKEELKKLPKVKKFDAYSFVGKVRLKEDPLTIQKKFRDEWE